ncbi:MAG: thioredoxin [Anaerolineales bacterium]|nr:MAG: thioredoxin [Anaerolineales bacterium]
MGELVHLDDNNFDSEVTRSTVPVLIDFYADWCPPCKRLSPIIEEVAVDMEGIIKVCKLDVQNNSDLATKYGVMNIPTMILFKDGAEAWRAVGFQAKKAIIKNVEANI